MEVWSIIGAQAPNPLIFLNLAFSVGNLARILTKLLAGSAAICRNN